MKAPQTFNSHCNKNMKSEFQRGATSLDNNSSLGSQMFSHARQAQAIWKDYTFSQRAKHIQKIARYIADYADEIALEINRATSKTLVDALTAEVISCLLACKWYSKNAEKYLKPKRLKTSSLIFVNKKSELHRVPLGVVAIISPWNYPLAIPFGEVIMGLMAGNAIILKVASNVKAIGVLIEKMIKVAGLPDGLFQLVQGPGAEVSQLFFNNKVDKIFFTGSVAVGKELMAEASRTLTPLSLELGGNDPMLVLEDANLERATNGACWGGFQNAGQTCGGIERVYVADKIYDDFLSLLIKKTKALRHGSRCNELVDIGGLTTKKQFETISFQVDDAVKKGAKIVAQSRCLDEGNSLSYPATVLTGINHTMTIMREETFGPVLCVMPFKSLDEAKFLANDSNLALTSSVWSQNHVKAYEFASKIEAGVTCINDHLYTHALSEAPWGGWKESGIGRTHGAQGLEEMTHLKVINWDILWSKRNVFWYPIEKDTYENMKSAIGFLYPKSFVDFVSSSCKLFSFTIKKMFTSWSC